MRRFLLLALLTGCSSESDLTGDPGADASVAQVPDDLPHRTYVIDRLEVPTSATEARMYGLDLDNDAVIDNQLGTVIGALSGMGVDASAMVTRAIDRGETILLAKIGTTSFNDAPVATFETFAGSDPSISPCASAADTACRKHLEGGATFTALSTPIGEPLVGRFDSGMFTGSGGRLVVRVALLGSEPIDLVLLGSRAQITMASDSTLGAATLAGAVSVEDIDGKVLPAVHANMMASVAGDCTQLTSPPACGCPAGSDGKSALAMFDKSPQDCSISLDEIKTNALIQNLLAPDVEVEGQMALSLGVKATAVTAAFTQ